MSEQGGATGTITAHSTGLRFAGYTYTWSVISSTEAVYNRDSGAPAVDGSIIRHEAGDVVELFLLENDHYGDEAAYLIVNSAGQIIDDECYDDIETYISSTLPDWDLFEEE